MSTSLNVLRKRNISDNMCRENEKRILCSLIFYLKRCRLWDNEEKYGRAKQATDDKTIERMCFAAW
jgi:hypothetical protein